MVYVPICRIPIPTLSTAWGKIRRAQKGAHDEIIFKWLSIASNGLIPAYLFSISYEMVHNTCIRENNTSNDDILLDDRHISYSQLSTVFKDTQTGYEYLIADSLWHREMVLPLLADTPNIPHIARFQLPTNTGTEITIILWFLQRKLISVHCAICYTHSLYK